MSLRFENSFGFPGFNSTETGKQFQVIAYQLNRYCCAKWRQSGSGKVPGTQYAIGTFQALQIVKRRKVGR